MLLNPLSFLFDIGKCKYDSIVISYAIDKRVLYRCFLNYQIETSSQQNTALRKWVFQLIGTRNGENIFSLSTHICNYLK